MVDHFNNRIQKFAINGTPPAIPSTPGNIGAFHATGGLSLSWDIVAGATYYVLYHGSDKAVTITNYDGGIYSVRDDFYQKGQNTGQTYVYTMKACNSAGCSAGSDLFTQTFTRVVFNGDFDGDGKRDVLWRNANTGQIVIWLMNGASIVSTASPSTLDLNWQIQGIADFNKDGKADILWRHIKTGEVAIWLMNGAAIANTQSVGQIDINWQIQSLGDFNGDGMSDVLWRNANTGDMVIWLMNGSDILQHGAVATVDPNWQIQGVSDFNGDGKSDLMWRNAETGQVAIWQMNDATITAVNPVATVPANWHIRGVQSQGGGNSNILWQDSIGGDVYAWQMSNSTIASGGYIARAVPDNWKIIGVGDFYGKGSKPITKDDYTGSQSDVLWQDTSSGDIYLMSTGGSDYPATNIPAGWFNE
ncbi:FG-GAP repeat-containing protein [Candidatus Magnetobacterium bavaricum]|uniref:FG-GAP repeat-containing protein n=1 Tax=Candidatus Magnetobacterium bavaricum TaxID=29290 RepID=A0A0F3GLW7_9BACT|nr:FG-GAP repeat-containing protein [Candidatus Magnetobacterium bavaricum]